MKIYLPAFFLLVCISPLFAIEPTSYDVEIVRDIAYRTAPEQSEYETERCKLDIYIPKGAKNFATLIWFHGGGLKNGDKSVLQPNDTVKTSAIAESISRTGVAVVVPNYRLSPKVKFPAYIQDAAQVVKWTKDQMPDRGADSRRYFVGGHSAGAYMSLMLAMDTNYLKDVGSSVDDIAGIVSVSAQTMTHYTVREERGIGKHSVTADEAAPVHFARPSTPPILVVYADRDLPSRPEENAYFVALMKDAGNKNVIGIEVKDRDHGTIASEIVNETDASRKAILQFIQRPTE